MAENNEKEIVVRGPSKPATPPEKKAEKDAERALEEERFGVLQISQKVGFYFSASILVSGILLLCFSLYVAVAGSADWIMISYEMTFLSRFMWIFVGIMNILSGLLLIGSE